MSSVFIPGVESVTRPRRVVLVKVTPELVAQMLTVTGHWSDHVLVECGLPEGARLVYLWMDAIQNVINLLFEHESFELKTIPPTLDVRLRTWHCGSWSAESALHAEAAQKVTRR